MVTLSSTSSSSRYLQAGLSVAVMGLSGTILQQRSTLSGMTDTLTTYYQENADASSSVSTSKFFFKRSSDSSDLLDSPSLYIDTDWKTSAISLASSSFTLFSNTANYVTPKLFVSKKKTASRATTFVSSFSFSEFVSVFSLASSEITSHALWMVTDILSLSQYASWDCGSVDSLLEQYNLTGNSITNSVLENFYNLIGLNENDTSTFNITEALGELTGSDDLIYNDTQTIIDALTSDLSQNDTPLDYSTSANLTIAQLQSNLLIALSQNCQVKKAQLGLSILTWLAYMVSTGTLTFSAVSFYTTWKMMRSTLPNSTNRQIEDEENAILENSVHYMYNFKNNWLFPSIIVEKGENKDSSTE